jgi:hypothetical protein
VWGASIFRRVTGEITSQGSQQDESLEDVAAKVFKLDVASKLSGRKAVSSDAVCGDVARDRVLRRITVSKLPTCKSLGRLDELCRQ